MLNETYKLTPNANGTMLSWTSSAIDLVSFISLDGDSVTTYYAPGTLERELLIPLSVDRCGKVEIHDLLTTEIDGGEIVAQPNTKPLLYWDDVATAIEYRIYTNEVLTQSIPILEHQDEYTMIYPEVLDTGWQSIRIEAVDVYGAESTRISWKYYVLDLPDPLKVTDVTGTGGVFTITTGAV